MHLSCCKDHVVPLATQKNLRACASFASCISSRWASRLANRLFQTLELWIDKGPSFLWTSVLSWIILLDYATSPGWTLAFCGHLHGCHQSSDGGALLGLFRRSGWGNCVRVNKRWTTPSTKKGKKQQHPHVFSAEEGVEDNLANLLILSKQSKKHAKRWIFGEISCFKIGSSPSDQRDEFFWPAGHTFLEFLRISILHFVWHLASEPMVLSRLQRERNFRIWSRFTWSLNKLAVTNEGRYGRHAWVFSMFSLGIFNGLCVCQTPSHRH